MEIEWDPAKDAANYAKHGYHLSQAEAVMADPAALTIQSPRDGEMRWVTIGCDGESVLVAVYTRRGTNVRVISVRPAHRSERRQYEGETSNE